METPNIGTENNEPLTLGFVQVWLDGITMSSSNFSVLQFGA